MSITPESIAQALRSEDLGDRLSAVNQLRVLPSATAFGLLKQAIGDSNSRVRYAAVSQMSSLGHEDLEQSLEILIARLYTDSETDVKAAAADAIGALQLTEAYPDLETCYRGTNDWLLQMSIVATLGELGDPRGFDLLKDALASPEALVQGAAIGSLGELRNPEAVPLLRPFATHEDWQVRYRVAQALGNLGGAEAKALAESLSHDEVGQVAEMAGLAIAQIQ
ncbi:phycobilisome degradation protein NblB [Altericista sp. CCNU0014]|uniref:phycobilisome degradation protein NblB n=1 Tax=Altericista sp. CCNU0014 TaxID=3082949 RepID=UPI00384F6DD1